MKQTEGWQVVGDRTGYYRAMSTQYKLQPHNDEFCVQTGLTYPEACLLALHMIEMREVQEE